MSEQKSSAQRRRRRRADADRSVAAILDASIAILGSRPEASMEEIATAAGVARQTIYAHYPTRQALYDAILDRITVEVVAAFDAGDLDTRPADEALRHWLDITWSLIERYPVLLNPNLAGNPRDDHDRHEPISTSLLQLIDKGRRDRVFDPGMPPPWLAVATIALGHAAGQQVAAGRMTMREAGAAYRDSVLRLYGVRP